MAAGATAPVFFLLALPSFVVVPGELLRERAQVWTLEEKL